MDKVGIYFLCYFPLVLLLPPPLRPSLSLPPRLRPSLLLSSLFQSTSQPMQQILTRMAIYDFIRVIVVCDDTILNKPVDRWPLCDAFLAFYSKVRTQLGRLSVRPSIRPFCVCCKSQFVLLVCVCVLRCFLCVR